MEHRPAQGRRGWVAWLLTVGFAIGGAVHATAFLLIGFGIRAYGPEYPAWRHIVMATVDVLVAWVVSRGRVWSFVVLAAWVAEQTLVNGFGPFSAVVTAAIGGLAVERWQVARDGQSTW